MQLVHGGEPLTGDGREAPTAVWIETDKEPLVQHVERDGPWVLLSTLPEVCWRREELGC